MIHAKRISWLGIRTSKFREMILFLKDIIGCTFQNETEGCAEFRLPGGEIIELFDDRSSFNPYFTHAPVPEFLVQDIAEAQKKMEAAGIEFLMVPKSSGGYSWTHFKAPDGNIMGLASGNFDPVNEFFEEEKEGYLISTNKKRLQPDVIHHFLSRSYWAKNRSIEKVKRSIEYSLCFGIYKENQQVGFCRVVSDFITFAWIADVFIVEGHRRKGLSKWLMKSVLNHPELNDMRRWVLATKDAHTLYQQFGFTTLVRPERWMEKYDENA